MISEPRLGRITQGTIFCGGYAEDYSGLPVWGLVITARCDTTHEKTPIVNYLPVVTVEDWLLAHGGILSVEMATADIKNRFKSLLTKRKLSPSLMEVHPPAEIVAQHFKSPIELGDQKAKAEAKDADEAREISSLLHQLHQCLQAPLPNRAAIEAAIAISRKSVENVVKSLIAHKLAGYYFIPTLGTVTERASKKGYVVLLREVHHVPRPAVAHLLDGVAKGADTPTMVRGLCFDCFDFLYPVAEVASPWIEHLMQSFCNLFGRIGVADIDKNMVTNIIGDLPFKE